MARIAGINIPQNKLVHIGLTYIYGIGDKFSNQICTSLEIPRAKRINELTPAGHMAEVTDISQGVLFFSVPASDYITGQILSIDGGYTLL